MTKDEALKMAIEALEIMGETYPYRPPCLDWEDKVRAHNRKNKALNACKEALATNEESLLVKPAIKESLNAQPAQEPVAYTDEYRNFLEWDMVDLCDKAVCKKHEAVPLYTHPAPAREWRRLSKKKLEKIYGDSTKIDWYAYEAIDKALQKLNPIGN